MGSPRVSQAIDDLVEFRRLLACHGLRTIGAQRHLPRVEEHHEAHDAGDREREQHPALSADHPADDTEERDHSGEEHEHLDVAHDDGLPAYATQ